MGTIIFVTYSFHLEWLCIIIDECKKTLHIIIIVFIFHLEAELKHEIVERCLICFLRLWVYWFFAGIIFQCLITLIVKEYNYVQGGMWTYSKFPCFFISLIWMITYSVKVLFNKLIRLSLLSLAVWILFSLLWII